MRLTETRDATVIQKQLNDAAQRLLAVNEYGNEAPITVEVTRPLYAWMKTEPYYPNSMQGFCMSVFEFVSQNNVFTALGRNLLWKIIRTCSRCECEIDEDGACGCNPPDA